MDTIHEEFVVKVRARRPAGRPYVADDVPLSDPVSTSGASIIF